MSYYSDKEKFLKKIILQKPTLPYTSDLKDVPGFILDLDKKLTERNIQQKILLPNLQNCEGIGIFSDYSEGSKTSLYSTYSFLICNMDWVFPFLEDIEKIRLRHGLDKDKRKEIAFTSRDFAPLRRALPDLLKQVGMMHGLLFTLIVDKKLISIFGENSKESIFKFQRELESAGLGQWRPLVIERLSRILHTVSYLFGLLSGSNQKVLWMTDNDDIVANSDKQNALGWMYRNSLKAYSKGREIDLIGFAKSFEEKMPGKDLNILTEFADLSAGTVQHIMNHRNDPDSITQGTKLLVEFAGSQGPVLQKLNYIISSAGKNLYQSGFVDIDLK